MKKLFLFTVAAMIFAACTTSEPTRKFIGVWEPVGYENCDRFVISSDTIKAVQCETGLQHYQCHYKILRDSVVELERCWMKDIAGDDFDYQASPDYVSEEYMYIDQQGYLIIRCFMLYGELCELYPNYSHLKLKRL